MRKKVQTRGQINGAVDVTQLGWVAEDRLESDVQHEKEHFTRLALHPANRMPIRAVEATEELLVVFYEETDQYLMIQWITETDQTS